MSTLEQELAAERARRMRAEAKLLAVATLLDQVDARFPDQIGHWVATAEVRQVIAHAGPHVAGRDAT